MRVTQTAKGAKECIIGFELKELFMGGDVVKSWSGEPVNSIDSSVEGILPVGDR